VSCWSQGIEFLVEKALLEMTKESVAVFLMDTEFLDKRAIGEYFGDSNPFNIEVLKEYTRALDFTNMPFDKALRYPRLSTPPFSRHLRSHLSSLSLFLFLLAFRKFLSGFRLPGEAQKIDRIMEIYASRYHENNPGVFVSPDTAYVLAFSVIMLNTDLHNPAVKNKITKQQFFKNNRGINSGGDLPEAFLSDIYDTIQKEEIKLEEIDNEASYTFFSPEREGFLFKQGGRVKTWKRRNFILTGNCLYYFKDQNDTTPCGIIPLENLTVRDLEPSGGYKCRFEVFNPNPDIKGTIKAAKTNSDGKIIEGRHNSYLFASDTQDEKVDWMNSIKANMAKPPLYALLQAKRDKVVNQGGED